MNQDRSLPDPTVDGLNRADSADVVVIGAGILGLMSALQLAKRHLHVVLIDDIVGKKRSYKVGESLLVFSNHFLRIIGDLHEFLNASFPKDGLWFSSGMEGASDFAHATEWAFQTKLPKRWEDTMGDDRKFRAFLYDAQIVRPEVENVLQQRVYTQPNITVLDQAIVKDVILEVGAFQHEVLWSARSAKETGVVRTRWVLDCSGRNRFLAKRLNHTVEFNDGFQTTAVWAQFSNVSDDLFEDAWTYAYPDGGSTKRDHNTCHIWGTGYWMWVIRLSKNRISIGVTYDQKQAPPGANYREQFWNLIDRYPLLRNKLSESNLLEMRTYRNVQYVTNTVVSPRRYGMVGDAASIIDAYYSQGISLNLVTSWHIANIIEQDVQHNYLDQGYIARVNRATWCDWHMMRNMIRGKYTRAINDSRFFLLSHLLDVVAFSSVNTPRFRLARWLYETEGDPEKETSLHKKFRIYLRRRLYYSQTPPWNWLSPGRVEKIQRHFHDGLTRRALWRLDHNVNLPAMKMIVRVTGPFPKLGRLIFPKRNQLNDISAHEWIEPAWFRITGKEITPLSIRLAGPVTLIMFLSMYAFDVVDTSIRKLSYHLLKNRYAEAWSREITPAVGALKTGESGELTTALSTDDPETFNASACDEACASVQSESGRSHTVAINTEAPDIAVINMQGRPVHFSDFWRERPTVFVFIRHLACPYCRLQLTQFNQRYQEIQEHGAQVVVVGMGDEKQMALLQKSLNLVFPMLSDRRETSYNLYGLKNHAYTLKETLTDLLKTSAVSLKMMRRGNYGRVMIGGNQGRMGGTFVIDTRGQVAYAHYDETATDYAQLEDILDCLKMLRSAGIS